LIPRNRRFQRALSIGAIAGVVVLVVLARFESRDLESAVRFGVHGELILVGLATVVVIAHIVTGGTGSLLVRILSNPVMVLIGKWSYGIYLVHKLFYTAFLELHLSRPLWIALSIAASFVAAIVLYYAVELPFLRLKERFSKVVPHAATQIEATDAGSPLMTAEVATEHTS
jgi:peptidoglycan/LPS O-acetylase OafA/YrhL